MNNAHAMVVNGNVVEAVTAEAFATFNPTVQALFVPCPANVKAGYIKADPDVWVAPTPEPVIEAKVILLPAQFYLSFTATERVAIKTSIDVMVKEFWDTYQLLASTSTPVDTGLNSITSGLAYLRQVGILASDARVTEIRRGQIA